MSKLESQIEQAQSLSESHAAKCNELLVTLGLAKAIEYCTAQDIEPPQCSLLGKSANADKQRAKAQRMLCEVKWWKRRLGNQARQNYELEQIKAGKVKNYISDGSFEHYENKK